MNIANEVWNGMTKAKRTTKPEPLPFVRHPTHLRLLGRDRSAFTPIMLQYDPVSHLTTPSALLASKVSEPTTRESLVPNKKHAARAFRDDGNTLFASPGPRLPTAVPSNSVNSIIATKAGFEGTSAPETHFPAPRRSIQQVQSTVRPARSTADGVGNPRARDRWGNFSRIFEEIFGISSAQAQAGPNNPNFAAQAREKFLKLYPKWIAGKEFYVKEPFTKQLVKLVPDVLRPTKRTHEKFNEYHAGELKAGRQSTRRRIIAQMLKYEWAKAGIYDRNGVLQGRIAKTTYFHQGNRKQLSQQSKSFRSAVLRHGHSFHFLDGKPKATNSIGNVPPKSTSAKGSKKTLRHKAPARSGHSHRGGGGGATGGVFKYNPFMGRYNHLTYIPFM